MLYAKEMLGPYSGSVGKSLQPSSNAMRYALTALSRVTPASASKGFE
jgi:hypothetical protein